MDDPLDLKGFRNPPGNAAKKNFFSFSLGQKFLEYENKV